MATVNPIHPGRQARSPGGEVGVVKAVGSQQLRQAAVPEVGSLKKQIQPQQVILVRDRPEAIHQPITAHHHREQGNHVAAQQPAVLETQGRTAPRGESRDALVEPGVASHAQIKPEVAVKRELTLQLERVPDVIDIKKRDPGRTGRADADVAGPPGPSWSLRRPWRRREGPYPQIALRSLRRQLRAPVCRAIVNEQQFPMGHHLAQHRSE